MNRFPDMPDRQARVLIVDDQRQNRDLLEAMLRPDGYQISMAISGEAALATIAGSHPDLVLMDVMMPGMSGYEVTVQLKADPATQHIPVILVTALDDRKSRMLGLEAGAEDFLSKPLHRAELSVRVRNLLRMKFMGDYYGGYRDRLEAEVESRTAELAMCTARYRHAIEATKEGAWLMDEEGKTTLVNRRMASMLGAEVDEVIGLSSTGLICDDDAGTFGSSLATLPSGAPRTLKVRLRVRDGCTSWMRLELSPFIDQDGHYGGALAMVSDLPPAGS